MARQVAAFIFIFIAVIVGIVSANQSLSSSHRAAAPKSSSTTLSPPPKKAAAAATAPKASSPAAAENSSAAASPPVASSPPPPSLLPAISSPLETLAPTPAVSLNSSATTLKMSAFGVAAFFAATGFFF